MKGLQINESKQAIEFIQNIDSSYAPAIKTFTKFLELTKQNITPDSIKGYFEELNKSKYSANSIRIRRQACKYAVHELLDSTDLFNIEAQMKLEKVFRILDKKVKAPKIQNKIIQHEKLITENEFDMLMNSVTPLMSCFIYFLYASGMRIFELCNIKHDDIKITGNTVYISTLGKGFKEREVKISLDVYNYVNSYFKGSMYLFEHNGKQYNKRYIADRFRTIGNKYLGRRFTPHMLRHTYCTNLLKNGVPASSIAEILGHSSTAITAIYSHHTASIEDINKALNMKNYSIK